MVRTYRKGPLTGEQRDMADRYYWYALRVARSYAIKYPQHQEEIWSQAGLSTCMAARSFDQEDASIKFPTYLAWRVRNDVKSLFRDYLVPLGFRKQHGTRLHGVPLPSIGTLPEDIGDRM